MNLIVDIGNTRVKLALYDGSEMVFQDTPDIFTLSYLNRLFYDYPDIQNGILSTVRDYPSTIREFLKNSLTSFIEFSQETPTPIINKYGTPDTLGLDRLAAAVGASKLLPNQNILVIDAGTAITFDLVTEKNEYLGGNISPGLETRFKSLNKFTGKLPLIQPKDDFQIIGTDTESAIRAGVQLGIIYEIEQYINTLSEIYAHLNVIITGGDSIFIGKKLKSSFKLLPNLTITGLNFILSYNIK